MSSDSGGMGSLERLLQAQLAPRNTAVTQVARPGAVLGERVVGFSRVATYPQAVRQDNPLLYYRLDEALAAYASTILADTPLAYYRLGDAAGQTVMADTSGHGYTGAYQGSSASTVPGAAGAIVGDPNTAASCNAASPPQWAKLGAGYTVGTPPANIFDPLGSITVEAWVKTSTGAVILERAAGSGLPTYTLWVNLTGLVLTWSTPGLSANPLTWTPPAAWFGAWRHVVAVYDASAQQTRLYSDGLLVASQAASGAIYPARPSSGLSETQTLGLGYGNHDTGAISLDEVAVYLSALTEERVGVHYRAGTRGLVVADSSGGGRNGVYTTTGLTAQQAGALTADPDYAITLDGAAGYVTITPTLVITDDYTFECWVKRTSLGTLHTLFDANTTGALRVCFGTDNKIHVQTSVTTLDVAVTTGTYTESPGQWHQLVVTMVSAGTPSVYWDGVLQSVTTSGIGYNVIAASSTLGAKTSGGAGQYFNGSLDEVSLYNYALSAARVLEHYRAGKALASASSSDYPNQVLADLPVAYYRLDEQNLTDYRRTVRTSSPAAYYRLGEASGTSAADSSGNARTGTYTPNPALAAGFTAASSQYLSIASNSQLAPGDVDFWFAGWIKPSSVTGTHLIIGKDLSGAREYNIFLSGASVTFNVLHGSVPTVTHTATLSTGTWYFVRAWYDSVNKLIGINVNEGTAVTGAFTGAASTATTTEFDIGRRAFVGSNLYFDGVIGPVYYGTQPPGGVAGVIGAIGTALYNSGAGLYHTLITSTQQTAWGGVSLWPLNDAAGATRVDVWGTNHLTDHNTVAQTTGKVAGAVPTLGQTGALTGDTDTAALMGGYGYVALANNAALHPGNTFTLETWFKRTATQGATQVLYDGGAGDYYVYLDSNNKVHCALSGGADIFISTATVTDQTYHHLVWTKATTTNVIYLDGVAMAGTTTNQTVVAASGAPGYGASAAGANNFPGTLDEGAIYATALTAAAVAEHYSLGQGQFNQLLGLTAADTSGNGRTGTYAGYVQGGQTSPLSGDVGTAVLVDGSTGYVSGCTAPLATAFTVEAWLKSTTTNWNANSTAVAARGVVNGFILHPNVSGKSWTAYVYDSTGGTNIPIGTHTPASITGWHHYAFTWDGSTGYMYFDGALVATSGPSVLTRAASTSVAFTIGADLGAATYLSGTVDEVAVYATALSAARILAHYQAAALATSRSGETVTITI